MNTAGNWAAVATPTCIFIGIRDRAEFDKLAQPALDCRTATPARQVLVKTIEAAGLMVVVQHWLDWPGDGPGAAGQPS